MDQAATSHRSSCQDSAAAKLYRTNLWPATTFGATAFGFSRRSLSKLRTLAAAGGLGKQGQCTTSVLQIVFPANTDPARLVTMQKIGDPAAEFGIYTEVQNMRS